MAGPYVGTDVEVTYATGTIVNGNRWTLTDEADEVNITAGWTATDAYETFGSGWQRWGGSWECRVDDTTLPTLAGTTGAATFTMATGKTFSGNIIVTGMEVVAECRGELTVRYTFRGAGTLTGPS